MRNIWVNMSDEITQVAISNINLVEADPEVNSLIFNKLSGALISSMHSTSDDILGGIINSKQQIIYTGK